MDGQAPPLVVNAFEVSKQSQGRRSWWNQLESILSAFNLAPAGSLLSRSGCSAKLQENFIQDWLNQLCTDSLAAQVEIGSDVIIYSRPHLNGSAIYPGSPSGSIG